MLGVAIALTSTAAIVAAYGWRRCYAALKSERGWCAHWKARSADLDTALAKCQTAYATERRKRLDAEQAHTDLADKHNLALGKLEAIRSIPNNGKKPNGGLLKAQRIAGAV